MSLPLPYEELVTNNKHDFVACEVYGCVYCCKLHRKRRGEMPHGSGVFVSIGPTGQPTPRKRESTALCPHCSMMSVVCANEELTPAVIEHNLKAWHEAGFAPPRSGSGSAERQ